MLKPQGYATLSDPEVGTKESDTFTCSHCNKIVHVPTKKLEQVSDFCRSCMKLICLNCAGQGCLPFLKRIEEMEEKDRIRRMYV